MGRSKNSKHKKGKESKSFSELKVETGESRLLLQKGARYKELKVFTQFCWTPSDMHMCRKVF